METEDWEIPAKARRVVMLDKENRIGVRLRALRLQSKLSTREVAEQSARLAQQWGNQELKISPSWLARVEREQHELTASKLIALAHIYHVPAQELLRLGYARIDENSGLTTSQALQKHQSTHHASNQLWGSKIRYRLPASHIRLYRTAFPHARIRCPTGLARALLYRRSSRSGFLPVIVMVPRTSVRKLPKS